MKVLKNILGQKDNQGLQKLAQGSTHQHVIEPWTPSPATKKGGRGERQKALEYTLLGDPNTFPFNSTLNYLLL